MDEQFGRDNAQKNENRAANTLTQAPTTISFKTGGRCGLQSLRWAKRDASLTLAELPKNFFIQIFTIAGFQRFGFDQFERSGTIGLALST
jgi:hypothetical protein